MTDLFNDKKFQSDLTLFSLIKHNKITDNDVLINKSKALHKLKKSDQENIPPKKLIKTYSKNFRKYKMQENKETNNNEKKVEQEDARKNIFKLRKTRYKLKHKLNKSADGVLLNSCLLEIKEPKKKYKKTKFKTFEPKIKIDEILNKRIVQLKEDFIKQTPSKSISIQKPIMNENRIQNPNRSKSLNYSNKFKIDLSKIKTDIQSSVFKKSQFDKEKEKLEEISSPTQILKEIYQNDNNFKIHLHDLSSSSRFKEASPILKNNITPMIINGSHMKRQFFKEYNQEIKDDKSDFGENYQKNKKRFSSVIFNNLSANAIASHKWRSNKTRNNVLIYKSYSPEAIQYPLTPKDLKIDYIPKNYKENIIKRKVIKKRKMNISFNFDYCYLDNNFLSENLENKNYIVEELKKNKENRKIFGMKLSEYQNIINIWKIDQIKSNKPNIDEAYHYMRIIQNKKADDLKNLQEKTKNNSSPQKNINKNNKTFSTPRKTNNSGITLIPKYDLPQINIITSPKGPGYLSPKESPISTSKSNRKFFRASPRFSCFSPKNWRSPNNRSISKVNNKGDFSLALNPFLNI